MKKNVGTIDRVIRAVVGLVIFAIGIYFKSWWAVVGIIPIATAVVGWCPPYALLGVNTCSVEPEKKLPEA